MKIGIKTVTAVGIFLCFSASGNAFSEETFNKKQYAAEELRAENIKLERKARTPIWEKTPGATTDLVGCDYYPYRPLKTVTAASRTDVTPAWIYCCAWGGDLSCAAY